MTEYVPAALAAAAPARWYVVSTEGRVLAAARRRGRLPRPSARRRSPPRRRRQLAGDRRRPYERRRSPSASPCAGQPSPVAVASLVAVAVVRRACRDPAASVELPRGTRRLPVVVTTRRSSSGATVADPPRAPALRVLAALPRRAASQRPGSQRDRHQHPGRREPAVQRSSSATRPARGQGPGPQGGARSRTGRTACDLHVRRRLGARPAPGRAPAARAAHAGGHAVRSTPSGHADERAPARTPTGQSDEQALTDG